MKGENNQAEQIERFLDGSMGQEEQQAFEQQLAQDAELAAALELHKEVDIAVSDNMALNLEADLAAIGDDFIKQYQEKAVVKKRQLIPKRNLYAIAAVGTILIAALIWLNQKAGIPPQQLFAENYEPYNISLVDRGGNYETEVQEGYNLYQNRKYQESIGVFSKLLNLSDLSEGDRSFSHFVQGLGFLALRDANQAIPLFEKVVDEPDYLQRGNWYLALAYLQNEEVDKAISRLKIIKEASNSGKYYHKTVALLERME